MRKVITFGTFDLLHEGHLRILRRARAEGDYLIVGVSSDQLNSRKGKRTIFPEAQRSAYVADLKYVDEVFIEESLELKDQYVKQFDADLLVMGDDWQGKFDWVSCGVKYLPRTEGISSTLIKTEMKQHNRCSRALFGDTYLDKHMDCAMSIVNSLTDRNIAPILTKENALPRGVNADALVYFNKPINDPFPEYDENKRILIDHGASHLKWFLGSRERFDFFDVILTAGPDHVRSLEAIFEDSVSLNKVRAAGFVKSNELLSPPNMSRKELCEFAGLNSEEPIVLFAPTWHITANVDIVAAAKDVARISNHVVSFHPETAKLPPVSGLNIIQNVNGITSELMKHADVVISDLSSTIYEAAALGKPIVQVLLREYPDNTAVLFDFPLSAGTAEHFCGGLCCSPSKIADSVDRVLRHEAEVDALMEDCRNRILKGTYINQKATNNIADQVSLICEEKRKPSVKQPGPPEKRREAVPRHRRNMFFATNRIIAHDAGNYEKLHASNSREAMEAGLSATNIVELDLCMGLDNMLVAHDTFETKYGLNKNFNETSVSEFEASRFEGRLTPVPIAEALKRCTQDGKALVCDIKPIREDYNALAEKLRHEVDIHGQISQLVIQCYSVEDFIEAMRLGYERVILAVWKFFYRDPAGEEAIAFFRKCLEINEDAVWGLSLPYQNKHMPVPVIDHPNFLRMQALWKRVFVHGAPPEEYPRILKMNAGLFADGFDRQVEFKDFPSNFNWRHYLFLNPDLVESGIDNEIQAVTHFLQFGQKNGRLAQYDLPVGFNYNGYISKNPQLRVLGITAFDSAAAHFMKRGRAEGLSF